jgi:hypothetical protein
MSERAGCRRLCDGRLGIVGGEQAATHAKRQSRREDKLTKHTSLPCIPEKVDRLVDSVRLLQHQPSSPWKSPALKIPKIARFESGNLRKAGGPLKARQIDKERSKYYLAEQIASPAHNRILKQWIFKIVTE